MKEYHHRRLLSLENWQSDEWPVSIQNKSTASAGALRAVKLARLRARPNPPAPRRTDHALRFCLRRRHTLARVIRKLAAQGVPTAGGAS